MYDELWLTFILAFLIAMAFSPIAIRVAYRIGAIDIPKDGRRMHTRAMPRFGGLAIFMGTMCSMMAFLTFDRQIVGVMIGGTLMYILGVIDDLKNLPAKVKFMGQIAIALLMYAWGLRIDFLTNFFGEGNLEFAGGPAAVFLTVIWIVGITNTVNLIDGLDGLAAGTSAISALCLAYVAYIFGQYLPAAAFLALAGGILGFLPFNFYPAKIFMGDGGSLFLGFMLASLSIVGLTKGAAAIAFSVPVFVLGLPIFDTAFAIFRRMVNHRPIMEADKGHLHHRLMNLGYGQRRATLMLYGVSAIVGVAAVMFSRNLNVEGLGLVAVAMMQIYIFLTDPNHVLPQIKQERAEQAMAQLHAKQAAARAEAEAEAAGAECSGNGTDTGNAGTGADGADAGGVGADGAGAGGAGAGGGSGHGENPEEDDHAEAKASMLAAYRSRRMMEETKKSLDDWRTKI